MGQLDDQLLQAFMERLNAKDEARMRAKECDRGLGTPELGGLVIQKVGQGMAAAAEILSGILDQRIPGQVEQDAATALVGTAEVPGLRTAPGLQDRARRPGSVGLAALARAQRQAGR